MDQASVERIASVIGNRPLAVAVSRSVHSGLTCSFVHLDGGDTVEDIFECSLRAAIRNIEDHPRGKLFRRLIEFGPHDPDEPEAPASDGTTVLSDPECGECVEFIFSHMVNRFKGELAEILAIQPCVALVQRLLAEGCLPSGIQLYWGGVVQEPPHVSLAFAKINSPCVSRVRNCCPSKLAEPSNPLQGTTKLKNIASRQPCRQ